MKQHLEPASRMRLAGIAILSLFLTLAGAAYLEGRRIQRTSDLITQDAVPGTIAAHKMRMALSRSVGWAMVAAAAQTPQARDASLKIVHEADVAFTNAVQEYSATIKIDPVRDRAQLAQVEQDYAEFHRHRVAYEALILTADREGSAAFLGREMVPAYLPVMQSAEDLLNFNHANSLAYSDYIQHSVHRLYWAVALVMSLAVICAAVLIVNLKYRARELAELNESAEKFSKAFRANPIGMAISELDSGRFVEVNQSFCQLLGHAPENFIGRTSLETGLWADAADRARAFQALRANGSLRDVEGRVRLPDGGEKTVVINADLIHLRGKQHVVALYQDITERRRSAEAITLFRALVDRANDSIEVVDPQTGRFLDVNAKAGRIHGYTREEYLNLTVREIDPAMAAGGEPAWQHHLRLLKESGFRVYESEHERRDGTRFPVEINASYVCLEREYILAVVRDITERKRVEQQIRRLNRVYAVISGINELIVRERNPRTLFAEVCRIVTERGGFRLACIGVPGDGPRALVPVACTGPGNEPAGFFGLHTPDELQRGGAGLPASAPGGRQICNDIGQDPRLAYWREEAARLGCRALASFPLRDGSQVAAVLTIFAAEAGFFDSEEVALLDGLAGNLGFALELNEQENERRRAEQSLRASEAQFATAFEHAPIGKALIAPDGGWIKANNALCAMLGLAVSELPRQSFQELTHADDLEKLLAYGRRLMAGEIETGQLETRFLRPDGRILWAHLAVSLVRDDAGAPVHFIYQIQDITERCQAEQQVRRLNRVYAMLSGINVLIVRERNVDALLAGACRIAVERGGFRMAWIGMLEPGGHVVTPVASAGGVEGYLELLKIDLDDASRRGGPTALAMLTGEHQYCNDIANDPRMQPWRAAALQQGYRSAAILPLRIASRTVGVLGIYAAETAVFDFAELGLVEELANDIGFALELNQQESERRRVELDLAASEQQFASAFVHAPIGMALVTLDGFWFKANRTACRMLGYELEALCTKNLRELTHPDDLARDLAGARQLLDGQTNRYQVQKRYLRADGRPLWVELSVSLITDEQGRPRHFIKQFQDISQRESLLQELGKRVKELRLLNQTARLFQRQSSSLQELLDEWVLLFPEAWQYPRCCEARIVYGDRQATTLGWRDAEWKQMVVLQAADGAGLIEVVYLEPCPAAAEGPFLAEERTLLNSLAEMLVGYLELRRYRENLELLVTNRTRDLRLAKEDAEKANRTKSLFLANISHEIRTPMNAVLGYAQLLESDGTLPGPARAKASVIRSSGDHLLQIVNDVLEMSRIEAGRVQVVREAFDLGNMLEESRRMFLPLAAARHNSLVFDTASPLPEALWGDVGKVRQVLFNLLSNAVKFTTGGNIRVTTLARPIAADVFGLAIEVADDGPGMAAPDLARIFNAFEQTESGLRAGGTGLGLTISRTFARLLHGDLTVASELGRGSTFRFTFEATAADTGVTAVPGSLPAVPARPPMNSAGCRALIVDDVATNREVLSDLLTINGFETRMAADGPEGIRIHDAWRPQVVLLDIRMPEMDGFEVMGRLRQGGSKAVIVALTASVIPGAAEKVLGAGGNALLLKPYREVELLTVLAKLLAVDSAVLDEFPPAGLVSEYGHPGQPSGPAQFTRVPGEILESLREAAMAAHVGRIEALAARMAEYSPAAAEQIRTLAANFQYDELLETLATAGKK